MIKHNLKNQWRQQEENGWVPILHCQPTHD
jgi:hypothetical protein